MDLNLEGTVNDDILNGSDGNDSIFGDDGNDTIDGGAGNDLIDGGAGNDCIDGGAGDDLLIGFFDNDTIEGGSGNDTLIGFSGDDTLIGGDGSDVFVFDPQDLSGFDTVEDFVVGEDTLEIRPIVPPSGDIPEGGIPGGGIPEGGIPGGGIPEGGIPGGGIPEGGIPGGGIPEGGIPDGSIPDVDIQYDRHTGVLSVDGNPIAQLPSGLDLDFKSNSDTPPDDAGDVPVVTLSSDVTEVNEGEKLALDIDLSSPAPAGGLTVELDLIEGSDSITQGFEFLPEASSNITDLEFIFDDAGEATGAEVTIAEGATDASIVSEIVADNLTEGDETVSLGLVDLDTYDVDGGEVNFTIIDTSTGDGDGAGDVPVVTLSSDVTEVNEGEKLALDIDLSSPAPAGGLTVELDLIEGSDSITQGFEFLPEASSNITDLEFIFDDAGEATGAEVTIAEGATDASIVSEIVADNLTEGDETVSLGLVDLDTYDVDGGEVNFTIIDTSTDLNTSVEVDSIEVDDVSFSGNVDFAVAIDYDLGIDSNDFITESAISNSIKNYIASELLELDSSELNSIVNDLAEFLADDSGLGIGSMSESLTLDISIAADDLIPEPISATSTVDI